MKNYNLDVISNEDMQKLISEIAVRSLDEKECRNGTFPFTDGPEWILDSIYNSSVDIDDMDTETGATSWKVITSNGTKIVNSGDWIINLDKIILFYHKYIL